MAITYSDNFNKTLVEGQTTNYRSIYISNLNFKEDYIPIKKSNTEIVLLNKNISQPIDCPQKIRYAVRQTRDIYLGTKINPVQQAVIKYGYEILIACTSTLSGSDTSDAKFRALLPASGHIVVKWPVNADLTDSNLKTFIQGLLGAAMATNAKNGDIYQGIKNLLVGARDPRDWAVMQYT